MNIIKAMQDPMIFNRYLEGESLKTWLPWVAALRCLYGLPVKSPKARKLVKQCTGRAHDTLPNAGFDSALFLVGRRGGKSRICAFIAAYESVLGGYEEKLCAGEEGVFAVVSPTKEQSQKVMKYLKAMFEDECNPLLSQEVVNITKDSIELRNNIVIKIRTGDYRSVRGDTLIGVILDEVCFFGVTEESKVKNDEELVNALEPGLATTGGKMIAISSPYAKKGWAYKTWKRSFGNDCGFDLVWQAGTRTMNPSISQEFIDRKLAKDRASASSEYLAEWRDDIADFLPRELIEKYVVSGRTQLMRDASRAYFAFVDVSGGRGDDSALAIGHKGNGGKIIIDFAKRWKAPHVPTDIIAEMCRVLERYHLRSVTGDNYSAEFVVSAFRQCGVNYRRSKKNRSELYLEFLPKLLSGHIELLDDETLVSQFAGLERRTRSGGRDSVDHRQGAHDDLANVVAGVADTVAHPAIRLGAL